MNHSATYSPDDDKIRLYPAHRLDAELYARVKAAGFRWAPKQELFFAVWTPRAEDICIELAGEIGDEDTSLIDRAEERADRFEDYSDKRAADADRARAAVDAIADNIPLGQPILVNHHSEKHARRDAARIESGMRKAIKMWETSTYWTARAAGAIRHAKYKELPSVRARRIKTIEADKRKSERNKAEAEKFLKAWQSPKLTRELAIYIANHDHISACFPVADYPRAEGVSKYEGSMSLWGALTDGIIDENQAKAIAIPVHERMIAHATRWSAHYDNRLAYERAMLADAGGTVADKVGPEKGGAVRCWASPGFGKGWSYIRKVNKVSVSIDDVMAHGGRVFSRTIPFDKLTAVMTAGEVAAARAEGRIIEDAEATGFFLAAPKPQEAAPEVETIKEEVEPVESQTDAPALAEGEPMPVAASTALDMPQAEPVLVESEEVEPCVESQPARFDQAAADRFRATLAAGGVKVVAVPDLFATPVALAARVVEEADIHPGDRILEPSAGTGRLIDAALLPWRWSGELVAVERNYDLVRNLVERYRGATVMHADFLELGAELGTFDVIIANPPFADQADIKHVLHAAKFLKPGGRLVAIMSASVTFRENHPATAFREFVESRGGTIEPLPADSFKESGTGVNAVLVSFGGT